MAKKSAEMGDAPNITNGYRANVLRYQHGICTNAVYYKQAVASLHEYYQKYSGQGTTTIADFEDQVLTQFIPDDFYDSFTDSDKNKALHEIVSCIVTALCESVVSREILPKIIDNHPDSTNVAHLQQLVVSTLCTRRDDYFVKFAKQATRSANGNNSVDIDTFNALKVEFINEKRTKCDAESAVIKLKQMLASAVGRIKEQAEEINNLGADLNAANRRVSDLSAELEIMRRSQQDRGRYREQTPYPREPVVEYPSLTNYATNPEPRSVPNYATVPATNPEPTSVHTIPDQTAPNTVLDILGLRSVERDNDVDKFQKKYGYVVEDAPATIEVKNIEPVRGWGLDDDLW